MTVWAPDTTVRDSRRTGTKRPVYWTEHDAIFCAFDTRYSGLKCAHSLRNTRVRGAQSVVHRQVRVRLMIVLNLSCSNCATGM